MNSVILFLVKSIIVSGVLTTWYWLGLRNKRLHNYNRFFLLFTLYASIQVPLLHFEWFTIHSTSSSILSPASILLHIVSDNHTPTAQPVSTSIGNHINWLTVLWIASAIVSTMLLLVLFIRIVSLMRIRKQYPSSRIGKITLINTDLPSAPFSFLTWLFWKDSIPQQTENGELIFKHEMAHIDQGHTYDKLACQALTCIFWFNPFYWIIQKELNMIHEFIADEKAIDDNDTNAFARMLLQTHDSGSYLVPEHQFFSSPVKRRLIMLQKSKKISHTMLRRLMVLPLAAGAILIFSFSPLKEKKIVERSDKKLILLLDPGHGGSDVGVQYGPAKEKDINLKIARRMQDLSSRYNIETHLTRDNDADLTLQERVAISNKLHPDGFISLHVTNDAARDMRNGNFDVSICFENPKLERSKQLGWAVYERITAQGGVQKKEPAEKRLYVLRYNEAPSVLIELGDIKNNEQMQWINDDAKLDELCNAVLAGMVAANKN